MRHTYASSAVMWLLALCPMVFAGESSQERAESSRTASDKRLLDAVVAEHNAVRSEAKLGTLTRNDVLDKVASEHAADMARRKEMTHEGADGSTAAQRVERAGYHYRTTGENVARGQSTAPAVMSAWMNSPPHKENILGKFEEIGVGLARDGDGQPFWCVEFATPWPKLDAAAVPAQFVDAVNVRRKLGGKKPLKLNSILATVAGKEALLLAKAGQLDASDNRGDSVARQVRTSGYAFRSFAQMSASGQPTAPDLASYLLDSQENRDTLLGDYSDVGIGIAFGAKSIPFWTIILARPLREAR